MALVAAEARAAAAAVATFPSEISCSTFFFPISLSLSLQVSVSSLFSSVSFSSGGKKNKPESFITSVPSLNRPSYFSPLPHDELRLMLQRDLSAFCFLRFLLNHSMHVSLLLFEMDVLNSILCLLFISLSSLCSSLEYKGKFRGTKS